jgi:hypothetical protein
MKSIYDKATREELIDRIHLLDENCRAQWGKMTACQMVEHCRRWEEMIAGKLKCERAFIGRLIGKMALKNSLKEGKPMMRNAPSSPELIVKGNDGNLAAEKAQWITLFEENARHPNPNFLHPFFGMMTEEQVGYLDYQHIDHHLRQFSV